MSTQCVWWTVMWPEQHSRLLSYTETHLQDLWTFVYNPHEWLGTQKQEFKVSKWWTIVVLKAPSTVFPIIIIKTDFCLFFWTRQWLGSGLVPRAGALFILHTLETAGLGVCIRPTFLESSFFNRITKVYTFPGGPLPNGPLGSEALSLILGQCFGDNGE